MGLATAFAKNILMCSIPSSIHNRRCGFALLSPPLLLYHITSLLAYLSLQSGSQLVPQPAKGSVSTRNASLAFSGTKNRPTPRNTSSSSSSSLRTLQLALPGSLLYQIKGTINSAFALCCCHHPNQPFSHLHDLQYRLYIGQAH